MTQAATIRCIYCGELKPPTKEHVVQKSLGGNLSPPLACGPCNNGFSTIDKALADQSLISLTRVGRTVPTKRVKLGGTHFHHDEKDDLWVEVEVSNGFTGRYLPQIHRREREYYFRTSSREDIERLLELIDERVRDASLLQIHVKVDTTEHGAVSRIVNYRGSDLYVRAASLDEGRALLQWLTDKWSEIRTAISETTPHEYDVQQPMILFTQTFWLDGMYRAIAKIAFNYVAFRRGAEFALRPEFNELREYILGRSVVHPDPLPEGAIAVDTRFVKMLGHGKVIGVPTEMHSVMLYNFYPFLIGLVTLYKDHSFIVALGRIELNEQVIDGHEFSTDGTYNAALDIMEIGRRMWAAKDADDADGDLA